MPGYPPGFLFENRAELADAGVHRHPQAGICGSQYEGAESVVLSGGYEDDADERDEILYTGHGGRNEQTGRQISDQPFSRGNRALAYSKQHGLPVRVIRGSRHDHPDSPPTGYRYDGLYRVDDFWRETGSSGFQVWRFKLLKLPEKRGFEEVISEPSAAYLPAPRRETTTSRMVRDAGKAETVKRIYGYRCQMCGESLLCLAGPYAEAAHIRPLGAPHNGPDDLDNLLCLCPNHHVLFDNGGVAIAEDLSLLVGDTIEGKLFTKPGYGPSTYHLRYHRRLRSRGRY
ncbi:YDG/SRA domain-containing protein [Rubrobacter aplysinae]|uniref:YDG/SRA domain-containing protein n=1 Tax=Rubrobacter aplysinae TaxID=909625 RepID=UPI000B205885